MHQEQEPKLMTLDQVADYLQVCVSTIHNMRRDGRMPAPVKLGRKSIRWDKTDIDRMIVDGKGE